MPPLKPLFNFKYKLFFSRFILVYESMAMPLEFIGQSRTLVVVGSHEPVMFVLSKWACHTQGASNSSHSLLHSPLLHLAFKLIAHYAKT
jgi:hypothetical protein